MNFSNIDEAIAYREQLFQLEQENFKKFSRKIGFLAHTFEGIKKDFPEFGSRPVLAVLCSTIQDRNIFKDKLRTVLAVKYGNENAVDFLRKYVVFITEKEQMFGLTILGYTRVYDCSNSNKINSLEAALIPRIRRKIDGRNSYLFQILNSAKFLDEAPDIYIADGTL